MVAGKFTDAPFTELSLNDFKACTPDQVALIRKQLDDAGLSEDTVGQVPDDATPVVATATSVPASQPLVEDAAWQAVTLTVQEIKEMLADKYAKKEIPELPGVSIPVDVEDEQMERLFCWAQEVKPTLRRGKIFTQLSYDEMKKLYVLVSPAVQPAAVSLD
jgi:hypothetical protein